MVHTRQYRTEATDYATVTRAETAIGGVLRLTFPEPPAFNDMLEMAKQRTRKAFSGAFLKQPAPIVYNNFRQRYVLESLAALSAAGLRPPKVPWSRWSLVRAHFRTHQERDKLELMSGAKWCGDILHTQGWVKNDDPKCLLEVCIPTQEIDRAHRGVDLYIRRDG